MAEKYMYGYAHYTAEQLIDQILELKSGQDDKTVWLELYKAVISSGWNNNQTVSMTDTLFDAFKERWAE